ncbi:MAG: DUF386 domain-containing protein [Clostridiales bacterium]|nr:DUF386 domain-containing protein [Clostridiales bacterium]
MIYDSLKNIETYKGLGENYEKAIAFLVNTDLDNLEVGKYEIDGKNVYATVFTYDTIQWEDGKWEAHKNYSDIQLVISGEEVLGFEPTVNLNAKTEYDPVKDIIFFENDVKGIDLVTKAGYFAIFMPQDGHKPKVMNKVPTTVKKLVVKILEKE